MREELFTKKKRETEELYKEKGSSLLGGKKRMEKKRVYLY